MPKIKTLREDIIRPQEARVLLKIASTIKPGHHKNPVTVQALIAFLMGYGKRITETISLKREDIHLSDEAINARFLVLKRGPESGILPYRWKMLSREHYTAPYIMGHVLTIEDPQAWIFPGSKGNHISRVTAWRWLKEVDEEIWGHLFRHSLATLMGEAGGSAYELKSFFDWASIRTSEKYVMETPAIRNKWVRRDF